MKWTILIAVYIFLSASCQNGKQSDEYDSSDKSTDEPKDFFYHIQNNGRIIIPSKVNGQDANLLFDTGTPGQLILKSSFSEKNFGKRHHQRRIPLLSGFSGAKFSNFYEINDTANVTGNGWGLTFNSYGIVDDNSWLSSLLDTDGLMPLQDSLTSLEIRFSDRQIYFNEDITWEKSDLSLRIDRHFSGQAVMIDFPLLLSGKKGIVSAKEDLIIDTGYRGDIRFSCKVPGKELLYAMENLASAHHTKTSARKDISSEIFYINEESVIGRGIWIEYDRSIKNYTDVFETSLAVAGLEFLKSFDIHIDFVRDSVHLKKIRYIPLLNEGGIEGDNIHGRTDEEGNFIAMYIKAESTYHKAGLQPGDIIVNYEGSTQDSDAKENTYDIIRRNICIRLPTEE